jgi:energy-converting hydrogenase A subunit M
MQELTGLITQIREYINKPRKQHVLLKDHAAWNQLCSSMDVIGDIELALDAYLINGESHKVGERYLMLYGVLQSLFVQQDAVRHLSEALNIECKKNPLLTEIRETRNYSIGHPTKADFGKAFNFISRISLGKNGFTLITSYATGDTKFSDINVPDLIGSQRDILKATLADVIAKLKEEDLKHKKEFKGEKLSDIFPKTLGYFFEKIYEAISGSKPKELGSGHIKLINDTVEDFKESLKKRGILEADGSIKYLLDLIKYPIDELSNFFENPDESKLNSEDAYIFTHFIKAHIDELIEIANELDEEYASES